MELYLDTTSKCNRKCAHCIRGEHYSESRLSKYKEEKRNPLDTKDMTLIIDKALAYSENGKYGKLSKVHFSGGEPMLDPNKVMTLADHCRNRGLSTNLFTNGDAIRRDTGLLYELYDSGINSIQIGVHDYENLESLFGVMETKKDDDNFLIVDFIVNSETADKLSDVMERLSKVGAYGLESRNISVVFYDMVPLGRDDDAERLALKKGTRTKDELESLYKNLFPRKTDSIRLFRRYDMNDRPSLCEIKGTLPMNIYGDVGFCIGCYGPDWFGNVKTGNLESIILRRDTLFNIFAIADKHLLPYELAKKNAREKHSLDYDEWFRPYCSRILHDLFEGCGSIRELVDALNDMEDWLFINRPGYELDAVNRRDDVFSKMGSGL